MAREKRGQQKGAQQHAEGEHGEKTKARHREILQSRPAEPPSGDATPHDQPDPGAERLFSHREQHDEAELNSEKTRLSRDISRHGHVRENFQVVGGAEAHPAMPGSKTAPDEPNRPNPSDRLPPDEIPDRR
jgi:hypothetical protein